MKVLLAVFSVLAVTRGQLIDPYANEGLLPYNGWPQQPLLQNLLNPYAVYPFQQQLPPVPFAPQPYPLLPVGQQLPPVPVPFPAQYPLAGQQLPPTVNYQLPLPQQPSYQQMQVVRHGLPHSDAAAVSYSSLSYNNPQAPLQQTTTTGASIGSPKPQAVTVPASPVNGATVPVTPAVSPAVVKDIATFGTEYGTGTDKSPVARYEAINAGSVHVAPLPGHTVDQKLIAPGTAEQKA
ncbi:uncharacterized protein LOC126577655 [Anopheles aquasalis]|uniref:uncharacterized protein LOC126577655 n=1 Tax=Anopheles aquasalis TaxID=42839 RepID=UPI00215A2492|nr:uncharacterized protein LOC126577655 [Anopheles aquasalis]